jgi:hypothetical protein
MFCGSGGTFSGGNRAAGTARTGAVELAVREVGNRNHPIKVLDGRRKTRHCRPRKIVITC